ncbi:hypothetical protein AOLI_G00263570 [Acnodon oligacanthus]
MPHDEHKFWAARLNTELTLNHLLPEQSELEVKGRAAMLHALTPTKQSEAILTMTRDYPETRAKGQKAR